MQALVLDSAGLSGAVSYDKKVQAYLEIAWGAKIPVATSAAILVEVTHARTDRPRLNWLLSKMIVEPVTPEIAKEASALLIDAGLHGHKYAIDAMLAATALRYPGEVAILTSDTDDMTKLLSGHPRIKFKAL